MPVRVLIVSNCDGLASIASRTIINMPERVSIVGIVQTHASLEYKSALLSRAIAKGGGYYACYAQLESFLSARVRTSMDCPQAGGCPDLREISVPRLHTRDPNDDPTLAFIDQHPSDFVLSIRPMHIFRNRFIEHAPHLLNLHCTDLPKYRGIAGVMRAMAAGDEKLGLALHLIDGEKIDAGPVVAKSFIQRRAGLSVFAHTMLLNYRAGALVLDALSAKPLRPQAEESDISIEETSWPSRKLLHALHQQGHNLLQWADVRDPDHMLRDLTPMREW